MDGKTQDPWEAFLNPSILRPRIITASVYIAAFELLKAAIVDRIKDFYVSGFDAEVLRIDPEYQSEVLSKNRSPVHASLEWLKDRGAISDADIAAFEKVKKLRNEIAHELTSMLFHGLPAELAGHFEEMVALLTKIERWWIVNVDIATDPDLQDKEIDEEGVIPGQIMGLRLLIDIALGSDEEPKQGAAREGNG